MTPPAALEQLQLPQVAQIGFVVRHLGTAIKLYEPVFGTFKCMDGSVQAAEYRGHIADAGLKIAFAWSGAVEIELIEWVSGESPHREFIQSGRQGMHHLQFRVEDCDGWIQRLKPLGYEAIWYKCMSPEVKFAYMERAHDPLILEFLQMPGQPGSSPTT